MRIEVDTSQRSPTRKTLVISGIKNKGGVGNTTNMFNFACWLAMKGYSVCLLDGDMQGDSTALCRVPHQPGMYRLLVDGAQFDDVWVGVPGEQYGNPRGTLFVVPSDEPSGKDIFPHLVAKTVANRLEELRGRFDVVIVDTPPSASEFHAGLLLASDYIIYPTQCQAEPINALKRSLLYYQNYRAYAEKEGRKVADILGIMPVMFRGRDKLQYKLLGWLEGHYDEWVMPEIRDLTAWQQAAAMRLPIFIWDDRCRASKEAVAVYEGFEAVMYGN